jgi:hypothetical protein
LTQFKIGDIVRYRSQENCFGYVKAVEHGFGNIYIISWFDGYPDTPVGQFTLEKVDKDGN